MASCAEDEDQPQAKWVRYLPGQIKRSLKLVSGPLGISQGPQSSRLIAESLHRRVHAAVNHRRAVQSRLVKGADPFEMRLGREELSHDEEDEAQSRVSIEQNSNVLLSLPDSQQLRGQLMCRLQLPPYEVNPLESKQNRDYLRRITEQTAEFTGS